MTKLFEAKNTLITQQEEGIFVNDTLFLPVTIQKITPYYHFTSYSEFSKEYELEIVETNSRLPDHPITLRYTKEEPKLFIRQLRTYKILSDFSIGDVLSIWELITDNKEQGIPEEKPVLYSDRCGWIIFENELYYMTANFAIGKHGIIYEYHCTAPCTCLEYDEGLSEDDAFLETLDFLQLDFSEVMPIFVTQILSFQQPVVEREQLRSIPGLILSGPTSTGKTELSIAFGSLFGDLNKKDLRNILVLQGRLKKFEQQSQSFSDTTFILDDARKPGSPSLRQSIENLIDQIGRTSFMKTDTRLTPIISGEPLALSSYLESLRNRFVEVYLNLSPENMNARKLSIERAKKNIKPLRTCLLYFIRFISDNFQSSRFSKYIQRVKRDFENSFGKPVHRSQDNLFMHYFGFRLFLYYGSTINAITCDMYERCLHDYTAVLETMEQNNGRYKKEEQATIFVQFLCNSLENGNLNIYIPTVQTYWYGLPLNRKTDNNTYGFHSVIDIDHEFQGVYIKDRSALPGNSSHPEGLPVLLLNATTLLDVIDRENAAFEESEGYKPLPVKESDLKHLLDDTGLLYTEERYDEKNRKNYTCQYPHFIDERLQCDRVFCINMESPYVQKLIDCIDSAASADLPEDCLYLKRDLEYTINTMYRSGFDNIRYFTQIQI